MGSLRWTGESTGPASLSAASPSEGAARPPASWPTIAPLTGSAQRLAVAAPIASSGAARTAGTASALPDAPALRVARPIAPPAPSASSSVPATPAMPAAEVRGPLAVSSSSPAAVPPAVPTAPAPVLPLLGSRTVVRRRLGEPLAERPASMVAEIPLPVALPRTTGPSAGADQAITPSPLPVAAPRPFVARAGDLPAPTARPAHATAFVASATNADTISSSSDVSTASTVPLLGARPLRVQPRSRVEVFAGGGAAVTAAGSPSAVAGTSGGVGGTAPAAQAAQRMPAAVPVRYKRSADGAPERVPENLRAELEPMLGADLSAVPVHRGESSEQAAVALQAKAFTTGGEVHLPSSVGSLASGEGRSVLAHELTHVAQQRRLGTTPDENTAAGQAMEEEARQVGEHIGRPSASRLALASQRMAAPVPVRSVVPSAPRAPVVGTLAHRAGPRESPLAIAEQVRLAAEASGVAQRLPDGSVSFATIGSDGAGSGDFKAQRMTPIHATGPGGSGGGIGGSGLGSASAGGDGPGRSALGGPAPAAPSAPSADFDPASLSHANLEVLAGRLYDRMRSKLRSELLADRERAGKLHDRR